MNYSIQKQQLLSLAILRVVCELVAKMPELADSEVKGVSSQHSFEEQKKQEKEEQFECRICKEDAKAGSLVSPCNCDGSLKYVHKECLLDWVRIRRDPNRCSVCKANYKCRFELRSARFITFIKQQIRGLFFASVLTLFVTGLLVGSMYTLLKMDLNTYNKYVSVEGRHMQRRRSRPMDSTEFLIFKLVLATENVAAIIVLWLCFVFAVKEEWSRHMDYYYSDEPRLYGRVAHNPQQNGNQDLEDDD